MSATRGSGGTHRRAGSADRQAAAVEHGPLVHELMRLRNELHVKSVEIQERSVEIGTLQKQLRAAEHSALSVGQQLEATRDRLLSAQKEAESTKHLLAATQTELDALRRETEAMARGAMRALDHESAVLHGQLAVAEAGALRAKDLESEVAGLRKKLAAASEEVATLQRQQRAAEEEVGEARQRMLRQERELGSTSDYLAGIMSELAATQDLLQKVRQENKVLQEQVTLATGGGRAAAAPPPAAPVANGDGGGMAAASAQAALQQAMQQLSLRTQEVADLKKQLHATQLAQAAVAAGSGGCMATLDAEAAATAVAGGSSGPATPVMEGAEETATAAAAAPPAQGIAPPVVPAAVASEPAAAAASGSTGPATPADGEGAAARETAADTAVVAPVPPLPAVQTGSSGISVDATCAPLPRELMVAHQQIVVLQEQVARLRRHLADAAAAGEDSEGEGSSEEEGDSWRPHSSWHSAATPTTTTNRPRGAALSPTEQAAEERRRNAHRGTTGTLWLGGQRHAYPVTDLTPGSLANMIDRLVQAREDQQRQPRSSRGGAAPSAVSRSGNMPRPGSGEGRGSMDGASTGGSQRDDTALWEEATTMLRNELIRLGQEAARKMEENERLRSEVGELKTARLSAEAVAARLEEMNTLSIRVASLKLEIASLKSEQDIREDELLAQIAVLQQQLGKKKRRSPGKILKKTLSHAVDSLKQGLQGHPEKSPGSAPLPPPAPASASGAGAGSTSPQPPAEVNPDGGDEVRRSWGSLKSKFSSLGSRGGSKEEEVAATATSPGHK